MPKRPGETDMREQILQVAKTDFLEKGYEKTSVRSLASKLDLSAPALYWHFENKEALLEALVAPLTSAIMAYSQKKEGQDLDVLATAEEAVPAESSLDDIWDAGFYPYLLDLVYSDLDTARLLFVCSKGSRYEHFFDELILEATQATFQYLERARKAGIPVNAVDAEDLHIFMSLYYDSMLEPVRRHYTRPEAERYLKEHERFFIQGWRSYLNI